jgi:hypothetical protein
MKDSIKHIFICDFCREKCEGNCFEQLMAIKNADAKPDSEEYKNGKDLIGRKQIIHCLGKYCDMPCDLQRENFTPYNKEDGLTPLFDALRYMVSKCNELLIKEKK